MAPEDFYQKYWCSASKQHRIRKGIYVARFDSLANEVPSIGEGVTKSFSQQKEMAKDDHGPVFCINGFFSSMRQSYNRSTTCFAYMLYMVFFVSCVHFCFGSAVHKGIPSPL